ncbi:MAG: VPLPA-CTERM sorting domain-containing protein [Gammaproteobacteria bacterium]
MLNRSLLALFCALMLSPSAHALFINELHYDNAGSDVGEGVELAGAAGTVLDGFSLLLYNGGNGQVYRKVALSGTLADQSAGFGTQFIAMSGIQNGGPDGIALIDSNDSVVQFLSYEGAFTASDGAAAGLVSDDIGLFEDGSGAEGLSLQLVGTGIAYADFAWDIAAATYARVNVGQAFEVTPVPLPASVWFLLCAAGSLSALARRESRGLPAQG